MRKWYAWALYILMTIEMLVIGILVISYSKNWLKLEPWVLSACVAGVFGQIAALIGFIVKGLFKQTGSVNDIIQVLNPNAKLTKDGRE